MIIEAAVHMKGPLYRLLRLLAAYHKGSYSAGNSYSQHSFLIHLLS